MIEFQKYHDVDEDHDGATDSKLEKILIKKGKRKAE